MEWSNDLVLEFLELYEKEPTIWNPRNPRNRNRKMVRDSWKNISNNLSVTLSITDLKKKKDSLMATFRKLSSRVRASKKTRSGTNKVFTPDWFAYEKMATFLHGVFQSRMTTSSKRPLDESTSEINDVDEDQNNSETLETALPTILDTTEKHFKSPTTKKKRKIAEIDSRLDEAYNILKKASAEPSPDICSLYTELLAKKLRAFDDNTRELAMHEIDNYLFYLKHNRPQAQLNDLPQTHQSYNIQPLMYPSTQQSSEAMSTPLPSPPIKCEPSPYSMSSASSCDDNT